MRNFISGVALAVGLLLALTVFAKDAPLGLARPLLVDISQAVPIVADVIVPLEDGKTMTATVPLTVEVNLQIAVTGIVSKTVKVGRSEPRVTVATPTTKMPAGEVPVEQDVELLYGKMSWTVKAWRNWGKEYDDPEDNLRGFTSDDKLVAVYFSVENMDSAPKDVRFGEGEEYAILLIDAQGRIYDDIDHPYRARCIPLQINPGLHKSCILVYEIPDDASNFSIVFSNNDESNKQVVALDL